jgi:hypothetical protein
VPDFIVVDLLLVEYLLEELIISQIAYSSGFIVWISVRANPDDRVVIDKVPIDGRVGPSIDMS